MKFQNFINLIFLLFYNKYFCNFINFDWNSLMKSNFDPSEDENSKEKEEEINVADKLVEVSANELVGKFSCKAYICSFFIIKYQLFLPPYEETKLSRIEKIISIAI